MVIDIKKITLSLLCVVVPVIAFPLFSQPIVPKLGAKRSSADTVVFGEVVDGQGTPISGALITFVKSKQKTVTNHRGQFSIDGLLSVGRGIHVSALGFNDTTIHYDGRIPILIRLRTSNRLLEEALVIATGYSVLPKERATGSFATVSNQLLHRKVSPDLLSRLEDVTSSIYVDRRTGGEPRFSVRGRSTIFAEDRPLVVVDNFPYDGDLANINPNDVENVTVLKDAAATSIWGVRAGNGVLVIKTKKGQKQMPLKVEVNANTTIVQKPDLFYDQSFLKSEDFMEVEQKLFSQGYYKSWIEDQHKKPLSPLVELLYNGSSTEEIANAVNGWKSRDIRRDVDKYLYRSAMDNQFLIGFSGGSERSTYSLNAGYDCSLSRIVGNTNNRFTLNGNFTFEPVKNLDVQTNIVYTTTQRRSNGLSFEELNVGAGLLGIYPYARLADPEGTSLIMEQRYRNSYKNEIEDAGGLDWSYKPLEEVNLRDRSSKMDEFRLNTAVGYSFPFNLRAEIRYQHMLTLTEQYNLFKPESFYVRNLVNTYTDFEAADEPIRHIPLGAIGDRSNDQYVSQTLRGQLNYSLNRAHHEWNALGGVEVREANRNIRSAATMYGLDTDVLTSAPINFNEAYPTLPNGNRLYIPNRVGLTEKLDRFRSFFVNSAYTYAGKYSLSASARIDQSNYFGVRTNQKSVPLWSTGFAWNTHKERFVNTEKIQELRLRATYGYSGNLDRSITAFTTASYFRDLYTGAQVARINNPPNPELRWERIAMLNLGVDFRLWNRVAGSVEYYTKNGYDIIGYRMLEPTTGAYNFGTDSYGYKGNFANTKGKGVDIDVKLLPLPIGNNISWATNLFMSYVSDMVSKYDQRGTASDYISYGAGLLSSTNFITPLQGKPVYGIYAYRWGGLDATDGSPTGYLNGVRSTDYNAIIQGTVLDDLVFVGRALPKIFGSFRNTMEYKNLSLSVNVTYKLGYYFRRPGLSYSSLYANWKGHGEFTQRWLEPGDEQHTDVPSMPSPSLNNLSSRDMLYGNSETMVEKGDNIRLKDIQLAYNFSPSWVDKFGINSGQLYLYMDNMGVIWKANRKGLDPDFDYTGYPPQKSIALGFKLNL